MIPRIPYATAITIIIPLYEPGSDSLAVSKTLASGDVKVSKDGGTLTNITTLPTESPSGSGFYAVSLSATETTCARIAVKIIDQTTPKEFDDTIMIRETEGNASAQYVGYLQPTTAGRTLAISAAGVADAQVKGIDADAITTAAFAAGTTLPRVTLVETTETNSDMRGTDNALLASTFTIFRTAYSDARAGYMDKLNVTGTLAHTDNADSFKADVSGLLTTAAFNAADPASKAELDQAQSAIIAAVPGASVGTGDTAVNHDYGGTDALRVMRSGSPVDGAIIRAYQQDDYAANATTAAVVGLTYTGSDGRWIAPLMLDADDYTVTVYDPDARTLKEFSLTVT